MTDTPIQLTDAERGALWYLPEAPGGKRIPEAIQQRLEDLGLLAVPAGGGKRGVTVLGDLVRRGKR